MKNIDNFLWIMMIGLLPYIPPGIAFASMNNLGPTTFRDTTVIGRDTIRLNLEQRAFDPHRHKIDSSKTAFGIATRRYDDTLYTIGRIDGHEMYGSRRRMPKGEIKEFDVSWNGVPIIVPDSLYVDCYDPDFHRGDPPVGIRKAIRHDGTSLLIEMNGGGSDSPYTVWWIITRDGTVQRYISEAVE